MRISFSLQRTIFFYPTLNRGHFSSHFPLLKKKNPSLSLRITWVEESQHGIFLLPQPIQQVERRRLFASPARGRRTRWKRWVGLVLQIALQEQAAVVFNQSLRQRQGQVRLPRRFGVFHLGFPGQHQVVHPSSPRLVLLFLQKGPVAHVVDIAEGMPAVILAIPAPAIMHTHALNVLEDADGLQGLGCTAEWVSLLVALTCNHWR